MEVIGTLYERPIPARAPLSPLARLTMDSLLLIGVLFAFIQVLLAGFAPLLTGFGVGALVGAAIASTGRRWTPLPGAFWTIFLLLFLRQEMAFDLTHPAENKILFSFSAVFAALFVVTALAGIAATVQNYRRVPEERRAPRFLPYALVGLAALCLGAILVTSILRNQVDLTAGVSPDTLARLPSVRASLLRFDRAEIRAKVGETVTLRLDNRDSGVHSFDIDELNVHAPMPVSQSGLAMFTPARPGTYTFYCAVPGHQASMNGKLIVEQ